MQFTQEYNLNWMKTTPTIFRHKECRWVTPFDIIINQNNAIKQGLHNTCGMGIWKTIQRFSNSRFKWSFDEFMLNDYEHQYEYIDGIANWYQSSFLKEELLPEYAPFFTDLPLRKGLIDHFISDCEFLYKATRPVNNYEFIKLYQNVIFENGQGLAIGDNGNDDSEKTPSYTGLKTLDKNFVSLLQDCIESFIIHYVSRTYETRHGDDTSFNPVKRKLISNYIGEDFNNHYNQWQGEFKYNTLNSMLLTQRILKDLNDLNPIIRNKQITKTILELTHCDEIGPENIVCNVVDEIRCTDSANIESINLSKLI